LLAQNALPIVIEELNQSINMWNCPVGTLAILYMIDVLMCLYRGMMLFIIYTGKF